MKKISVFLSVIAFTSAIASAFAFKPSSLLSAGYTDSLGNCQHATATCNGTNQNCRVDIPEVSGTALIPIKDYGSGCATALKMP